MNRQFFPLGKAYGEAFCNRSVETQKLLGNIESGKHSLLIAPRRYGKSSLAEKVIAQSSLPSVKINFHLCTSEAEVAELILEAAIKLIGSSIGPLEKAMASIKKYLSSLEPLLSFGGEYASLKLIPKRDANHAVVIFEALLLIERLLKEKNKKAILFCDEFQEGSRIQNTAALEGAIRTAAQEMQHLALIFSGSVRSLLLNMFEDEHRPLYKLCRKMKLERIEAKHYEKHLNAIAQNTWGNALLEPVFLKIMELSRRHPYYVNYLCDALWDRCQSLPTVEDVEAAWHEVVMEEWSDALRELADLPMGQRRFLKHLANDPVKNIQSQEATHRLMMPASSIVTAAKALIEKDYIEQEADGHYHIINPLLFAVVAGAED